MPTATLERSPNEKELAVMKRGWVIAGMVALSLAAAACGGGSNLAKSGGVSGASGGGAGSPTSAAATAQGDCAAGAQVVKIRGLDTLRFEPASVTVEAGQPVCFVVTNDGKAKHELVVGDRAMQDKHEQEMASGEDMDHMEMGGMLELELEAGQTKSMTTTFDRPGRLLYACHEPGHYKGGMVGTLTVTA
jgi:uncharacterized cupredoxin-like copper-binding protein